MPLVRIEPKISARDLPQTCILDRAASVTGRLAFFPASNSVSVFALKTFTRAWRNCEIIKKITDMRRLKTGIRSEKCVVRRFHRCVNVYLHKPR